MNRVLVDTNILVYAIDERSKFKTKARNAIFHPDFDVFTTSKNLSEFLAVATRPSNHTLPIDEAFAILDEFTDIFTILYPSTHSYSILKKLSLKYKPTGLLIHDFEIASIGLAAGITEIATFNRKDFQGIKEINLIDLRALKSSR
ncbi:MAG: type II toxin-antitoxin system VapC family toxin [bacterium]